MAITLGGTTFTGLNLSDQPFFYEEDDVLLGRTAEAWNISGICTPSDWYDLLQVYDTWRDARILETPPETSGVVGTTVSLSIDGPGSGSWTSVGCWFLSAPSASQSGYYLNVNFSLVNAAQQLQVILLGIESGGGGGAGGELLPDFGTYTVGSTTLTLRKPVDTYGDGPSLELTAGGNHYLTGPLVVYKIKDIEGETDLAGFNAIRAWYESQIVTTPSPGSYFPITPPTATAERTLVSGSPVDTYTVSIQLGLVL